MKRVLSYAVCLILVLQLCALFPSCGKDAGDSTETTDSSEVTASDVTTSTADLYSDPLNEDGMYKVRALDYVKVDKSALEVVMVPSGLIDLSDDDLTCAIAAVISEYADADIKADREIRLGDTVNIDYVGSVDGVEFSGGSTEGKGTDVTIGVTSYIDDFLYQLIGHRAGDVVNIEVTFPENYGNEQLNGKDALFVTTVNYILTTPELTDEFVKANLGFDTADAFIEDAKKKLTDERLSDWVVGYINDICTVSEVPATFSAHQVQMTLDYYAGYAEYYGMTLDDFISAAFNMTKDQFLADAATGETCSSNARYTLCCQAIAETLGLAADEEALADYFEKTSGSRDYSELENYYGLPYLKQVVLAEIVGEYIKTRAIK